MHIVVLDENQVTLEITVLAEVDDVLNVTLPIFISRMGFARKNKLNGPLFVARELHDVLELLKDQRRALIGREAAGKTDGQGIGVEQLIEGYEVALAQALALQQQAPAGKFDQFPAQIVSQRPDL